MNKIQLGELNPYRVVHQYRQPIPIEKLRFIDQEAKLQARQKIRGN